MGRRRQKTPHLFSIAGRFLESLNYERRGRGDYRNLRLSVLHSKLDSHAKAVPVFLSFFGDILPNLFWRETQRTDLGGERGGSPYFTTSGTEEDLNNGRGIELGGHPA